MGNDVIKKHYRTNVGMMILNNDKKIWMGKRVKFTQSPFIWQCPQGGVEHGESLHQAMFRELWEETGLKKKHVKILAVTKRFRTYDFPIELQRKKRFNGQRQKWFLLQFLGKDTDFDLAVHPEEIEFVDFTWMDPSEIVEQVIPFKQAIYTDVLKEFEPFLK